MLRFWKLKEYNFVSKIFQYNDILWTKPYKILSSSKQQTKREEVMCCSRLSCPQSGSKINSTPFKSIKRKCFMPLSKNIHKKIFSVKIFSPGRKNPIFLKKNKQCRAKTQLQNSQLLYYSDCFDCISIRYLFICIINKVFVLPCLWPTSARGFYEQSWCIPEVASRPPRPLEQELIHQIWKFWPTGTESKPH